jgi:hypothetical protein
MLLGRPYSAVPRELWAEMLATIAGLKVHAPELALEPHFQKLRRHRRPLLLCLEQPHRSTLENHVTRPQKMGLCMLINAAWYNQWGLISTGKLLCDVISFRSWIF